MNINCATSKTPFFVQEFRQYLLHKQRYREFCVKIDQFRYHGNKGRCGVNFNDTVKLCDPVWSKNLGHIYYTGREMANFALKFTNFRYLGNKGRSWANFHDTVKLQDLENSLLCARILAISLTQGEIKLILC